MHKPFFLLFALLCLAAPALAKDPVHLYMPDAPPLTLLNQGSHHGLTGDIVLAALARSDRLVRIVGEPWPRAQMRVASGRNLLIVPLSRTAEREEQYTWIASLMVLERAFFSLDEPVSSFAEALQRYQRIGVGLGTPQAEILKQQGFSESQIVQLKLGENPAWMLEKGRIDAWFTSVPEALYIWKDAQPGSRPLNASPILVETGLYLACSKNCDDELVSALRTAITEMEREGISEHLRKAYPYLHTLAK